MRRNSKNVFVSVVLLVGLLVSFMSPIPAAARPAAAPEPPNPKQPIDLTPQLGAAPAGVENVTGSTVNDVNPDLLPIGSAFDLCFNITEVTNDAEYLDRFDFDLPDAWTVNTVYDVPGNGCGLGHTFGVEAGNVVNWTTNGMPSGCGDWLPGTYDFCANITVPSSTGAPWNVPWNIWGDTWGSPPHSVSGAVDLFALEPGVFLTPGVVNASGCNGGVENFTFSLFNYTGSDGTFNLTYSVPTANGLLTGPATVVAANGETVDFDVTLTADLCALPGDLVNGFIDAAGNGYTASAAINFTVESIPGWDAIPGSNPSWGGMGYPRDGCTATNADGDLVTYVIGDMSSFTGFWGYNHDTNAWYQPGPSGLPSDRWAPDWAYDETTNLCYVTGGANVPGGGTYNDAYVFNPVANTFTSIGTFTSIRDFHNSWVGTIDGTKYLCIGGGVNASSIIQTATQCYNIGSGVWNAENAQMAAFPTDPFGAADGILHAPGGDQFWYVGGAINNFATVTDEARYWDDADNAWHQAASTGKAAYRVEGDFYNGEFYFVDGSSGGFTPTQTAKKGTFNGVGWTWSDLPNTNNARMDNIVNAGGGSVWSVDGYGSGNSAYVEKLASCPLCGETGYLEGTVLDGDTQPIAANSPEFLGGSNVTFDPSAGGATCYTSGTPGTFCFRAETFSQGWEYSYSFFLKFPAGWAATNAVRTGITCDNGSSTTWYGWDTWDTPNEVNLEETRSHLSSGDHCVGYYCVDMTPAGGTDNALVSWYWEGEDYGAPPLYPCSNDNYTPSTMVACDEAVLPQAAIPSCGPSNLNPPCTNATVTINPGNIVVPVDPGTGHYGPVQLIEGEYIVEATAPGFSTETASVSIVVDETTVQDFVLYRPVVDVTPTSIDVQSDPNVPVVVPMTVFNNGHMPLDFEFVTVAPNSGNAPVVNSKPQTPAADGMDALIAEDMAKSPDGKATFFIAFKDTADLGGAAAISGKDAKVEWVRNALRTAADSAQANVRAWLDQQGIAYKVLYIDNTIEVTADAAVLEALKAFPEIAGFRGNHINTIMPVTSQTTAPAAARANGMLGVEYTVGTDAIIPWDIDIMNINQVWDELGITGQGVVVANVDTGVYYQHESLLPNYLCGTGPHTDCWFDPDNGSSAPNDTYGHGTQTMSQMASDNNAAFQYAAGGAPDAGWIACMGCPYGSCPDSAVNGCFDWLLMTTPYTPDIVNNSWGTWAATCTTNYQGKLQAFRAADILPVFAAGNIGNACNTSTPPANNPESFAVGATTSSDVQASFSSTGPGLCAGKLQFPDVSAPGDATCAAMNGGGYSCGNSGTSFAAPRASGCLALMKSAAPSATIDQLEDVLMATATDKPNTDCGSPQPDPNYRYGDGRVDCFAAVSAIYDSNIDWLVVDPETGTVPPLSATPVDATLTCTPEQQGLILEATLRLTHNDPCADDIDIPVTFTCGQPTDPDIDVQPTSLSDSLAVGQTNTQVLDINNLGSMNLDWQIFEQNPGAAPAPHPAAGRPVQLTLSGAGGASVETNPPVVDAPVTLVLDDGSRDNDIGLGGTIEMLWVNRFTPAAGDFPFYLNQVQIYFSTIGLVNVGDDITIIIYQNTSGNTDPAVGSTFLASFPVTVQSLDTWNVYDLPTPVLFTGPGDVIIGAIGMETPGTSYWPASMDQTTTQQRSWAGWWNSSPPPNPPLLPPENWTLIDAYFPGNWMVRGYGETAGALDCDPISDIPWITVNPTSGTTPGYDTVPVDVTFDATGMAPGDYTANLCIASNDPDEPIVNVPLALNVFELGEPDIAVDPAFLDETLAPDQTSLQTVDICNNGNLDLNWNLSETGGLDVVWSDNFDSYDTGISLHGVGGWKGWFNDPAATAYTSDAQALSAPNSVEVMGPTDLVHEYSGATTGVWTYTAWQYIPSTLTGQTYFIMLNQYDDAGSLLNWSIEVVFDGATDTLSNDGPAGGTLPIVYDQWVEIRADINLDADTLAFYYGGDLLFQGSWKDGMSGGGIANIAAVDLFANSASAVYYDDISLATMGDVTWLDETPTVGTVLPGECTTVDVTFDSTDLPLGGYDAGLLIESNDPDTPQVNVPVHLEVVEACDPITGLEFVWMPLDPLEDGLVVFTATVTGGTEPIDYAWNFGDGSTDSGATVEHAFANPGTYTVVVTATNECSTETFEQEIVVSALCEPIVSADFTFAPAEPFVGDSVTFTGTAEGGTLPIDFAWNFGDGITGTGEVVDHVYEAAGTYTVTMTAENGCSAVPVVKVVTITEVPPVCEAPAGVEITLPAEIFTGDEVVFEGSVMTGTEPFTFDWLITDALTATPDITGTGQTFTYTFDTVGVYTVTLTVTNECGTATATATFTVAAPVFKAYLPTILRATVP